MCANGASLRLSSLAEETDASMRYVGRAIPAIPQMECDKLLQALEFLHTTAFATPIGANKGAVPVSQPILHVLAKHLRGEEVTRFEPKRVADTVVAVDEPLSGGRRVEIAVVPDHLRLAVEIKPFRTVPAQRAGDAVAVGVDRPAAEHRRFVGGHGAILEGDPADKLAGGTV